jgi:Lipocalin-like domain
MKKSSLIISFFFLVASTHAQSIVGSWKCLSNVLVNADGSKQDLWKNITNAFACATDMQYVFDANGTHYIKADKKCAIIAKMGNATWSQSGKVITLTSTADKKATATTYIPVLAGNTLTLTHIYTPTEKKQLGITTEKIILTYQKL